MGLSREDITIDAQQISAEPAMAKLDEMTGGE